jgi:hypothetical protein
MAQEGKEDLSPCPTLYEVHWYVQTYMAFGFRYGLRAIGGARLVL